VGLGAEVDRQGAQRARGRFVILLGLIAVVLVIFDHRGALFPGLGTPVRVVTVFALALLGWALAQSLGRGVAPALFGRMDPATAGTVLPNGASARTTPSTIALPTPILSKRRISRSGNHWPVTDR